MSPPKTTPMFQQYLSIKEAYPDVLLFYRMGDFYELFFEDAELASRLLEITLTSRNKKDKSPIPMCGVPVRAVQGYIARLIEMGHKVAICEQVEDPAAARGLVKREVVRVITPGMILENEFLDAKSNNYILSIAHRQEFFGIAYLDISTGSFRVAESGDLSAVRDEIDRVGPREVLLAESIRNTPLMRRLLPDTPEQAMTYLEDRYFAYGTGREKLVEQFRTRSLEGFGCETLKAAVGAAGALVLYVQETQMQEVGHLSGIETYSLGSYLQIDEQSCRNLELMANLRSGNRGGTLIHVLDRTITAMGGRLLKRWLRYPLLDPARIEDRLDAVAEIRSRTDVRSEVRENLKSVYDLERLGSKISMGHGNARDLTALKRSIRAIPAILDALSRLEAPRLRWEGEDNPLQELAGLIDRGIREDAPPTVHEGGMIRTGFNPELDELIGISSDGKGWLARLEVQEKASTGISSLKVRYNKVFGYYIEVPRTHSETVPAHYVRRQTLVNAERYITDELKSFETKVLGAEERRASLEYEIFSEIRDAVIERNREIGILARFLARIDCLVNLAEVAEAEDYTRPEINADGRIHIEDGRHPVVEKMLTGERYVPNSISMDNDENQILIITGPNMAGKSTVLRQVALQVLMAQMGSFVPAARASICITDRIFTRVGALDNLSQGQSTFMVEMEETANILNNATGRSLVVMDEIGRGTSTFDGLSIAWAVAEYLHDLKKSGVKTLFATHYHELTLLEETRERVRNYNIAVKEWNDEIIFLRKLVDGGTNRSYGIQVARLAGVPDAVIARAKKILSAIERGEHNLNGGPAVSGEPPRTPDGPVQMTLFRQPEQVVIDRLKKADMSRMTPLEALNFLSELQEEIRKTED